MAHFRKVERFIPTCPTCQGDMLDAEDYVPTHAAPWSGPEDPDPDELHCPTCAPRPIPYVLAAAPVEVIRSASGVAAVSSAWQGIIAGRPEPSGTVRNRPVRSRLARGFDRLLGRGRS